MDDDWLATVTPDDIERAARRIGGHIRQTPVITAGSELGIPDGTVLKLELLQHTGSFKPRGAFNRMLAADIPTAGVIAASGGNHGAAVAFAAKRLGVPAEVFVPSSSPAMKRDRIVILGADVTVVEGLYDDAQRAAEQRQSATGALSVHPFDHHDVVAGQGTMSRELATQVDAFDTLLCATGGGGFTAGQAAWWQSRVKVVSVEPETSQCLHAARRAGEPVTVAVAGRAADSLGARRIGDLAWSIVRDHVAHSVLVNDDAIADAQRAAWDVLRLVVEPGGAAALAAIRSGAYQPEPGERVVIVLCGANCDPTTVT
jgi:threonine dehydratase